MKRSELYASIADKLLTGCLRTIGPDGESLLDESHGRIWGGTVLYVMGELSRVRGIPPEEVEGADLIEIARRYLDRWEDSHEINVCFALMGLGMMGADDDRHPVLGGLDGAVRRKLREQLRVRRSFANNWEAFNGCIRTGRHLLYGEPAEQIVPHLEKIAAKYDRTGYFDDTADCGNYNSYGLMSLNYSLRAAELLAEGDPVRAKLERRFRPHVETYVRLIRDLIHPDGTCWTFGRSAGAMGQMQCMALLEQVLSKGWLSDEDAAWARAAARAATGRMVGLFWDEDRLWFAFHDEHRSAYRYRRSLPMGWDLLRYFLQLEDYARTDESRGRADEARTFHAGAMSKEIVTDPDRRTAIYVWSDGVDHAVLPIMGGPESITGDTMPRPFARGLFEWVTQLPVPVLTPRFVISRAGTGNAVQVGWAAWRAAATQVLREGGCDVYRVVFDRLVSCEGAPIEAGFELHTDYAFAAGLFERRDTLVVRDPVTVNSFHMEVLQPSVHPLHRASCGAIRELAVEFESDIESIALAPVRDVRDNPVYRNYYSHPSAVWRIHGDFFELPPGSHRLLTRIRWE